MKIVCVLGSPRESGNSFTVAKRFCDTARKLGAGVKTFTLNKLQPKLSDSYSRNPHSSFLRKQESRKLKPPDGCRLSPA
jgi:multimeric flavodoxin WrbA